MVKVFDGYVTSVTQEHFLLLIDLEFYGPVNTVKVMLSSDTLPGQA